MISPIWASQSVMFNYQGSVKVGGHAFTGGGQFKFAIVDIDQTVSLWSNDDTSVGGSEPTGYITSSVENGIFNVMIGDPSLGMEPINSIIFNHPNQIRLRIWFSDGTHPFEHLTPDRKITNPQLIGTLNNTQDFTIYVNGATGSNNYSGLKPARAKKTIQGAVNILPGRLICNVTIDIADGTYREVVNVNSINVQSGKMLTFLGDEAWTPDSPGEPTVRVSGKDNDTTTVKARAYCFVMQSSSNIRLKGLLVDNASDPGVYCLQGFYRFENCKAKDCKTGFGITYNSFAEFRNCVADNNSDGFWVTRNCYVDFVNCFARNNTNDGVALTEYSNGRFYTAGNFSNNPYGIRILDNSRAQFVSGYSGVINNNTEYCIYLQYNSYTRDHTWNTFSGNGHSNLPSATDGSSMY
jgi:hypothetical protein